MKQTNTDLTTVLLSIKETKSLSMRVQEVIVDLIVRINQGNSRCGVQNGLSNLAQLMSSYRAKLPAWLDNAYTESHIGLVLQTLVERETRRENIRSISRIQSRVRASSTSSSKSDFSRSQSLQGAVPSSHLEHYSIAIASQKDNLPRNRYADIAPYDRTRVIVETGEDGPGRYLNANWVLERYGHKWWIATQAPLPTTAHTFLSLIMQPIPDPTKNILSPSNSQHDNSAKSHDTTRIRTVVQLTRNLEGDRIKAHSYFPTEVGKSVVIPPEPELSAPALKVTLLHITDHEEAQCLQSTVAISPVKFNSTDQTTRSQEMNGDESEGRYGAEEDQENRVVFQHLMYTAWPDHGVPEVEDRTSLLAFLKLVDRLNRDPSSGDYPPTAELLPPPTSRPRSAYCRGMLRRHWKNWVFHRNILPLAKLRVSSPCRNTDF
ncbi:hypothetical protein NP233_g1223 [Leucocoprinus birnbaumii]|uniref:Tyrosine-protein phosphatase domain-containing protein n=1 Tax=Leucocoprinus birnbaumii TaxID=56174 RepID=A0AAD5W2M1_9AGAR|nr:hypothetical protein NP233_g1223 [Leucocoprinus birnbaumii]